MSSVRLHTLVLVALALASGCTGSSTEVSGDLNARSSSSDSGVSGDLPCNVASILTARCTNCHGSPPTNGAPNSLDSLAALKAVSLSQPSKTEAQVAVERMASTTSPMPPAPATAVPQADQTTFSSWVNAGMAVGSCGTANPDAGPVVGGSDGSSSDAGVSGDLPCNVAALLTSDCTMCHGTPPAQGAPDSLNTLATLKAPSISQPSLSSAQVAVQRMASTTAPMPPLPRAPVPAATQSSFSAWVSAGMPAGTCGAPTPDAGTPDGGTDAGPSDAGVSGDFPCNIAAILVSDCNSCHGSPPSGGAPESLTTLAALKAPSISQPTMSTGQVAVGRMANTTSPMPPLPNAPVSAANQSAFSSWVTSGMPAGTCAADAGTYNDPPTCTSGVTAIGQEGPNMRPGEACIACHSRGEGPTSGVFGTVYPTAHEPDDCVGSGSAGAVVKVVDAAGTAQSFTVNGVGNFSGGGNSGSWPVFPITATVNFQGRTRTMSTAVSSGDCNSCHTQNGANGAPGRIKLP
jgi:hypothetical protein